MQVKVNPLLVLTRFSKFTAELKILFSFFFKYPLDVSAGRPDLPVFQVINRPQFE